MDCRSEVYEAELHGEYGTGDIWKQKAAKGIILQQNRGESDGTEVEK